MNIVYNERLIAKYCKEIGISIGKLQRTTKMATTIANLNRDPKTNITFKMAQEIADITKKEFGKALTPKEYSCKETYPIIFNV